MEDGYREGRYRIERQFGEDEMVRSSTAENGYGKMQVLPRFSEEIE